MKTKIISIVAAAIILSIYFINCNKAPECKIEKINKSDTKVSVYTNFKAGEKIRITEFDEQERTVRSWTGNVDNNGMLEIKTGEMESSSTLKCEFCK